MIIKTFFAGFGGQGVLSMGYTLAMAAMLDDKYVTYFPSYGAEVRGGTANCTVSVGDEEIASPIASEPDYIVALNRPSMLKFENSVSPGGFMFLNSSLVTDRPARPDIEVVEIPASELAKEVADERSANMVVLGALAQKTGIVSQDALAKAITKIFEKKKKVLDASLKALQRGVRYMEEAGGKK
ncbi:MAG TPA: 2-oxoacid:acceptor oxidoreductase family protein [bacterium]|nr:2-oxoacid:acceptor oxidoreductase family protein [bacterium]